jgi:hypothetical protein
MARPFDIRVRASAGRLVHWIGRSGRSYPLLTENVETFSLGEGDIHLLAKGSHVLWVGSAGDLVADAMSRTRFRLALDCATHVLRLAAGADRHGVVWDLEDAVPAIAAVAQAA